jgi:hypothetical protein
MSHRRPFEALLYQLKYAGQRVVSHRAAEHGAWTVHDVYRPDVILLSISALLVPAVAIVAALVLMAILMRDA